MSKCVVWVCCILKLACVLYVVHITFHLTYTPHKLLLTYTSHAYYLTYTPHTSYFWHTQQVLTYTPHAYYLTYTPHAYYLTYTPHTYYFTYTPHIIWHTHHTHTIWHTQHTHTILHIQHTSFDIHNTRILTFSSLIIFFGVMHHTWMLSTKNIIQLIMLKQKTSICSSLNVSVFSTLYSILYSWIIKLQLQNIMCIEMIVSRKPRSCISVIAKQFFEVFISTESSSHELYKDIISIQIGKTYGKLSKKSDWNIVWRAKKTISLLSWMWKPWK